MSVISISSKIKDYSVNFGNISNFINKIMNLQFKAFIIDENVYRLYKDKYFKGIPSELLMVLPALEENKTLECVQEIYDFLIKISAKRNLTLISIGGGIIQDVSGFVASSLYRGINWIFIPTTLLAQADSCIGAKTSLNYKHFKNLLGTFFPPSEIWIDPSFLISLEKIDYFSGLGEVIKLHIMGGPIYVNELISRFDSLCQRDYLTLEKVINSSLQIKISYISNDEFDLGRRNLLNYGHCIGHAIESVTEFNVPHGQAILFGMIFANRIAVTRGVLSQSKCLFYENNIFLPALISPLFETEKFAENIIEAMEKDKKRVGNGLVLVMLSENDDLLKIDDLSKEEVFKVFADSNNLFAKR